MFVALTKLGGSIEARRFRQTHVEKRPDFYNPVCPTCFAVVIDVQVVPIEARAFHYHQ